MTPDELRAWREQHGPRDARGRRTQAAAAAWYGVHERSWRRWENAERRIPQPLVHRIQSTPSRRPRRRPTTPNA